MDISTAANVAEIMGGFAILVSLVYVGYQIRQSNRIASASALQSVLDRFSDRTINQYIEHPEVTEVMARGHVNFESRTGYEGQLFSAWTLREIFHMQNVMQLYKNGLLDKVDYDSWLGFTVAHLKTPGGRVSWNLQKVSLTSTIVSTLEDYMAANPDAPSFLDLYPDIYVEQPQDSA